MAKNLAQLIEVFESLWPISGAEEWDKPGLALGNPRSTISKALLSVDVTMDVLEEAKALGAELVISHHPPFLRGLNFLSEDTLKGELATYSIENAIAVYSAHTNADIVQGGVSDVFAKALGIQSARPLLESAPGIGHGRIGKLEKSVTLREFAKFVSKVLPKTLAPIRVAGELDQEISLVAVVGGAGDSFIETAIGLGADCLVTSDLRHHLTLDAVSGPKPKSISLIDVSHFAAESLWLDVAAKELSAKSPEVQFLVSEIVTDPWTLTLNSEN